MNREEKKARKEEARERFRAKLDTHKEERKREKEERQEERREPLRAMLQPDETLIAILQTGEIVMKKDVLFTSKRLIVALTPSDAESIPYRNISSFRSSNFLGGKDIVLEVVGRREKLELTFRETADRDRALAVLNERAL